MGSFREEFMRTERTLAIHRGAIKERFIDAVIHGIAALRSNKRELDKMPEDLREHFLEFMEKLTARGGSDVAGEGSVHGTLKLMSDDEIQVLVNEFLALSYEVQSLPR
jgi:hypothetical protein